MGIYMMILLLYNAPYQVYHIRSSHCSYRLDLEETKSCGELTRLCIILYANGGHMGDMNDQGADI